MKGEDKTRLIVVADVIWDKPCLLRSRIETESFSGLKKYYEIFEKELFTEIAITGKMHNFLKNTQITQIAHLNRLLQFIVKTSLLFLTIEIKTNAFLKNETSKLFKAQSLLRINFFILCNLT